MDILYRLSSDTPIKLPVARSFRRRDYKIWMVVVKIIKLKRHERYFSHENTNWITNNRIWSISKLHFLTRYFIKLFERFEWDDFRFSLINIKHNNPKWQLMALFCWSIFILMGSHHAVTLIMSKIKSTARLYVWVETRANKVSIKFMTFSVRRFKIKLILFFFRLSWQAVTIKSTVSDKANTYYSCKKKSRKKKFTAQHCNLSSRGLDEWWALDFYGHFIGCALSREVKLYRFTLIPVVMKWGIRNGN